MNPTKNIPHLQNSAAVSEMDAQNLLEHEYHILLQNAEINYFH
jgi:hypothetical protein